MTVGWGSKVDATQLTGVGATEQLFDSQPQLDPNQQARVQVQSAPSGSTDNLIVSVYTTLDGVTWDSLAAIQFEIESDAPHGVSFNVPVGVYQFRVGVQSTGSTDTFTADMSHRVATLS